MFDFVRKTRAPMRRQFHQEEKEATHPFRVIFFHPRLFLAIGVLAISLIIGYFIVQKNATWDGKAQRGFVIVFGGDRDVLRSLAIVVVNGEAPSATVLPLPENLVLETIRGYGVYKTSSLYGLAALEKLPRSFVTQTVALQFGMDVRDIVWIPRQNQADQGKQVDQGEEVDQGKRVDQAKQVELSSAALAQSFFREMFFREKSTFSMADRYTLWRFFSSLRKDRFSSIDLASSSVLKPEERTDIGKDLLRLDPVRLDPLVFQLFSDDAIRKENMAVSIVNTTDEPRLGTRVARAFSNMGVDVISVTSTSEKLDVSQLLISRDDIKRAKTLETMKQTLLLGDAAIKKNSEKTLEYRSDIVLLIGNDLATLIVGPIVGAGN